MLIFTGNPGTVTNGTGIYQGATGRVISSKEVPGGNDASGVVARIQLHRRLKRHRTLRVAPTQRNLQATRRREAARSTTLRLAASLQPLRRTSAAPCEPHGTGRARCSKGETASGDRVDVRLANGPASQARSFRRAVDSLSSNAVDSRPFALPGVGEWGKAKRCESPDAALTEV
jgi:hypothetical protein